jgi:hypothetical protein
VALALLALACGGSGGAGPPAKICPGTVNLWTAPDMDALNASGCTQVDGVGGFASGWSFGAPTLRLEKLVEVTGTLMVYGMDVTTVELPKLTTVGGDIVIFAANGLATVSLPSLLSVGRLTITNNPPLTDFEVPTLRSAPGGVTIDGNHAWPTCRIDAIVAALEAPKPSLVIGTNGPACP